MLFHESLHVLQHALPRAEYIKIFGIASFYMPSSVNESLYMLQPKESHVRHIAQKFKDVTNGWPTDLIGDAEQEIKLEKN